MIYNYTGYTDAPTIDLQIESLGGTRKSLLGLGVKTLDLRIPSPQVNVYYESVPGLPGLIELDSQLENRVLTGTFIMDTSDYPNYVRALSEVYSLLTQDRQFYLYDSREPLRRWLVRVSKPIEPTQVVNYALFEVEFISASPYSQSTFVDMKTFTVTDFIYNNEGSAPVDPRATTEFVIRFKGVSENLKIANRTTGESWTYFGTTNGTEEQIIQLKGITSTKDAVPIFVQSSKSLITLRPGTNHFELFNTTGPVMCTIMTRFYYL